MRKQILLLFFLTICGFSFADSVEIDGIYYNIIEKGNYAEVASNPNYYSGNIEIPKYITYDGNEFPVKSIGEKAFSQCKNLLYVKIPDSITSIGDYAFWFCSGLTTISIPSSVTDIGDSAFSDCSNLSAVYINDLGTWCNTNFEEGSSNPLLNAGHLFLNGEEIVNLIIPDNISTIGKYAFNGGKAINSVIIGNNITSIGRYAFSSCQNLTKVTLPNSLTRIDIWLFAYCESLNTIVIPNSIKEIGSMAFYKCNNLETIILGSGISTIESRAFSNCSKIKDVYCYAEEKPDTWTAPFEDSQIEYSTLHVPSSSIEKYKDSSPWKDFKSIIALKSDDPNPTGIKPIFNDNLTNGNIYDLQGKKIINPQKGIYILNGKKIILIH